MDKKQAAEIARALQVLRDTGYEKPIKPLIKLATFQVEVELLKAFGITCTKLKLRKKDAINEALRLWLALQ